MKTLKFNFNITCALAVFMALALISCTDNPADPGEEGPGEEELITLVELTLTELDNEGNATQNETTVTWEDEDGPGGNDPVIGTMSLEAGKSYSGTIRLLNTTVDPADDITVEVQEEADEHQFFYTVEGTDSDRLFVETTDQDSNGLPVGLEYLVTVTDGEATSLTLNVVLSHYDDSPKDGTTRSDETDIDVDIPVEISVQ